jgi:hypothetical protein
MLVLLTGCLSGCGGFQDLLPPEPDSENSSENEEPVEPPPGNVEPGGSSASAEEPTPAAQAEAATPSDPGSGLPLKPVKFSNSGTLAYTVSVWTYQPLEPNASAAPSDASTIASPGGNPSSYLSLPLGSYTWCYHWEQGDLNGDGMIDYAHAYDGRKVLLDESDSDALEFAEVVSLSAPTAAGEMPGTCSESSSPGGVIEPRLPSENGELLFSDDGSGGAAGMFGEEYMAFAYQGGQAQHTANASNFILPAMYSGVACGDCIIEVDFTSFNAGAGGQYSIIFRSDDVDGGLASYYIVSLVPGTRMVELGVWKEGWTQSQVSAIADESISLAAPVHFRLEVRGDEIAAFINGAFAAGFTNSQISSAGILGMSITTDSAPGSYTYDNFKVYALP